MTLAEIQKFFAETFEADLYNREIGDKIINIEPNRTAYVDGVYAEQDGVLYRRNDAPRRYMPEMQLNAFTTLPSIGGDPGDWGFSCEQEFYDSVKDETFSQTISVHCLCNPESYNDETGDYDEYYRIYIEKLPIREY